MQRSFLQIILLLLFSVSAFTETGAQRTAVRCPRSSIESYSEHEKRPVLQYLDEARGLADEFIRLLAEGKSEQIYKLDKGIRIWVQGDTAIEVNLDTFEQKHGRISHYEYRNQDVVYYLTNPEISLRGTVGTWYVVETTKQGNGLHTFLVETKKVEDRHIIEGIYYRDWGQDGKPTWFDVAKAGNAGETCPRMKEGLRVKAP